MGMLVPASDTHFLQWFESYVRLASEERHPSDGGIVRLSDVNFVPVQASEPLRAWIGGGFWDNNGQGYPLFRPLELALTPIAPCDRVEVELYARDSRAQAYLVGLVVAINERWPEAAPTLWIHASPSHVHRLVWLKVKTDPYHFALGLEEFAGVYDHELVTAVSFSPQPAAPGQGRGRWPRQRAWEVLLHLPGPPCPYRQVRALSLDLTLSRLSGKYPVMITLTRQGYVFPEVTSFARDFSTWCRENWRTASVQAETPVTNAPRAPRAMPPAGDPWELIPDHLWDRRALRLWCDGLTSTEIGERISQAPKTVRNRLSQLRKQHGAEIVPLNRRRDRTGTLG
jgi:hypothetical protein